MQLVLDREISKQLYSQHLEILFPNHYDQAEFQKYRNAFENEHCHRDVQSEACRNQLNLIR
jgi:hypothetical protein